VADGLTGYKEVSEDDRRKAQVFFDRAKSVAGTGNYDYSIEMYIQGLNIDPENTDAHAALREMSLKRKVSGGKAMGMWDAMKLKKPTKDDKLNMLNAEKLLGYDPGNTDHMLTLFQSAHREGCYDTCIWIGKILMKANADSPKPEFNKFIILRDIFRDLRQWKDATDACHLALQLRPEDMDLQTELKNLGAQHTMDKGNYGVAKSFRDSIRDAEGQQKLIEAEKDVRSMDSMQRAILDAENDWKATPNDSGKLIKLIEALERTERPEYEERAMALLIEEYEKTKQFRFRQRAGRVKLKQLSREERTKRAALMANPKDEAARAEYGEFRKRQLTEELEELNLWSENYPTDMGLKHEIGKRLFELGQYDEAIPILQQSRTDPKFRHEAGTLLGRAFLEAAYTDEAVDTLKGQIDEYQIKGDARSKEMYYWYARSVEKKGDNPSAIKAYSQVAQWDFNYRDVQARIKRLRSGGAAAPSTP